MVPFQNCVRQPHPTFKMAHTTKNRNFFCLLLPKYNISWNFLGNFTFTFYIDFSTCDKRTNSYKFDSIKGLLNTWYYRELSSFRKITVIITLTLPNWIQSLTELPNPLEWVIKGIKDIFMIFRSMGRIIKLNHSYDYWIWKRRLKSVVY